MSLPLHSQIRKKLRTVLNRTLSLFSSQKNSKFIDPSKIKKILLIRINYRMGNIIFMTPLIRALEKKLPDAKVDILVGASFTAPIIQEMPNIENVYIMSREITQNPIKLFKEIKKLNQNSYDLIINPITGSVTSNIATYLIKSTLKLGFYKKDTWTPFNRTIEYLDNISHEALKPLALIDAFSGKKLSYNNYLDIVLSDKEKVEGREILSNIIKPKIDSKIIGIFRDARGEKRIENNWWVSFIEEMQKNDSNILFVDILAPNEKESLIKDMPSISSSNLRELAKIFSALDVFICGDTGPMHLASASFTPTIALFNVTSPSLYGPLGERDRVVQINDKAVSVVVKETYSHFDF